MATPLRALRRINGTPVKDHDHRMHSHLLLTPVCDPGERWYVIQTQPNKEPMALVNLQRQKFRTFMPQIFRTVRHARRTRTVKVPLFPRYFFTPLNLDRVRWRCINGSLGVVSLIMSGERPKPVPEGVVESLAAMTEDDGLIDLGRKLARGDKIRVLAGPFADQLGNLIDLDDNGRAQVLLEIMGGARAVTLSSRVLTPVNGL